MQQEQRIAQLTIISQAPEYFLPITAWTTLSGLKHGTFFSLDCSAKTFQSITPMEYDYIWIQPCKLMKQMS